MNAKSDTPCRYFIKGNCREGEECQYSHDTQNIEKVNLIRDDKGKLNLKKNNDFQFERRNVRERGRGRGIQDREQDDELEKDYQKKDNSQRIESQQQKNQNDQKGEKRFGEQQERNEDKRRKQRFDKNLNEQENKNKYGVQGEINNVNSERLEKYQENNNEDDQKQYRQRGRGRGRGRGGDRENTFKRREFIQDEEKERGDQIKQKGDGFNKIKKVKVNEIQVKKRIQVLNLEQKKNIDNLIQIVGYNFQFLGILKSNSIDFYQIPFKRNGILIVDDEKKVTISHLDKQFICAFIQEHKNDECSLMIQFQKNDESFKNLLIFNNVFHQQIPQIIFDISMKDIVYTNLEDGLLYTFCKDGLIRIFQQNEIGQFKYIQHYNLEQSIENVIKVGSNYLIGVRTNQLYLFNGTIITEIPYKFNKKCTQMIIDLDRVILKMDEDISTSIYVLSQKLEIIGPIYEGEKVICLEIIKSYESDKLFIFGLSNSVEIYTEIENKLYPINVILNQKFIQMKKIEITNENMVTQKFIVGEYDGELKIFSVVPEQ